MIFFNEKKIEKDSDNFWCGKLTLKVRNWQFSITWFRAGVDLPENNEKVLFFTQLSYHLMCKLLKKSYMLSSVYVVCTIVLQNFFWVSKCARLGSRLKLLFFVMCEHCAFTKKPNHLYSIVNSNWNYSVLKTKGVKTRSK